MIKLKKSQMQAAMRSDAAFAEWYCEEFMKVHLPQSYFSVSDEGRREMVLNGRRYAQHFGFSDLRAQAEFITLMWKIGANFFVQPGFAEALSDRTETDLVRIDGLYNVSRDQAADAILKQDARYWYPEMLQRDGVAT